MPSPNDANITIEFKAMTFYIPENIEIFRRRIYRGLFRLLLKNYTFWDSVVLVENKKKFILITIFFFLMHTTAIDRTKNTTCDDKKNMNRPLAPFCQ